MAVIYKITNPKGGIYIGSTTNFERRMSNYKNDKSIGQSKLHNSLQKYGFKNHKTEILYECPDEERYKWENHYGMIHNVLLRENLNLALPKVDDKVPCISEETRRKISEAGKGEKNPFYGKHHSDTSKKKISDFMKGENNPWLGKCHSDETKHKMSESSKGDKNSMYGKTYGENPRAKKVINIETKIIYSCIKEAAEQTSYSCTHVFNMIHGKILNKTSFMLLSEWEKLNS